MPLEIKELQINVTVNDQGRNPTNASSGNTITKERQKAMIQQVMDDTIDIINNQKER